MSEKKDHIKLTDKQRIFIDEYLVCWNATEAAKKAGYSEKTAYSSGQRLLKDVEISRIIDERKEDIAKEAGLTKLRIIRKLLDIVDTDIKTNKNVSMTHVLNATLQISKMMGYNEAEKIEHSGGIVWNETKTYDKD